jgi:hypothetical protein
MTTLTPLDWLKSLTFGGLVGATIGVSLYLAFPTFFSGFVGIKTFCGFLALLGASIQRGVTLVIKTTFPSIGRFASHYERLLEATMLYKAGVIPHAKYEQILDSLTNERFLPENTAKQLPPVK